MAITQTALAESVLSASERNVLRNISRIALLLEANNILAKVREGTAEVTRSTQSGEKTFRYSSDTDALIEYCRSEISMILRNTKVPSRKLASTKHPADADV
jgi:hypothetical protein